jgi:hypothetical protein
MEKLELYKEYKNSIARFEKYIEKIKQNRNTIQNPHRCDKHRDGFVKYRSNYGGIHLNIGGFESFSGSFGSSDVYSDIDGGEFETKCMTQAIDNLRDEILEETLAIMKQEAEQIKQKAIEEYKFLIKELEK